MSIHSPSTILIDSGGGWFDSKKPTAGLFTNPSYSLKYLNNKIKVFSQKRDKTYYDNPLKVLEEHLSKGYYGIGYIGYNFLESTNKGFKSKLKKDGKKYPQLFFHFYKPSDFIKFPFDEVKKYIVDSNPKSSLSTNNPSSNLTKSEYEGRVRNVREYIASGDIYQVNLSQRFYTKTIVNPISYFIKLFNTQPVPYSSYINFNDFQLISGSMELYLDKKDRTIITKPIKGTIKRGKNDSEDEKLKNDLENSTKEKAENVMIVDLMRNDLGRICEYGSIKVNKLFNVKAYETLYQMESEIEGELKSDIGLADIIYNTFPPGSVTGAPKRRALEIIDELEPHYRGPYCGAICLFFPNGDFKMSVAIRIKINESLKSTFWVGSGIVWDSDPENEYNETLLKSKAIIKATEK